MGHAVYYISRCQNTQLEATHLNISQKAPILSLQLENTRNLRKKLTESEKKLLLKYKNTPSNIGKWDFHSIIFQGPKHLRPE